MTPRDAVPDRPRRDARVQIDSLLPGVSTESGSTRRTALRIAMGVGYAAVLSGLPTCEIRAID